MKTDSTAIDQYRIKGGIFPTDESAGMRGCFYIPHNDVKLTVIVNVSPGDVEHISISAPSRKPNAEEIKFVKSLFWEEHEMQSIVLVNFKGLVHPNVVHIDNIKHVPEELINTETLN